MTLAASELFLDITELVNSPGILFLDEATTGLDPGLESRVMALMRDLATTRAVVTITHATKNLGMCDKIVAMGRSFSFNGACAASCTGVPA